MAATDSLRDDGLVHLWSELKTKFAGKVDVETGKGIIDLVAYQQLIDRVDALQQGTYDDTEVRELIQDNADDITAILAAYLITVKVNGVALTKTNNEVDITVPTKTSELTNDALYQTLAEVQSLISAAVASAVTYKGTVAQWDDLPASAAIGDMYNVQNAGPNNNAGDNVVWSGTEWDVQAGTIDTSHFMTVDDVITNARIDEILAM